MLVERMMSSLAAATVEAGVGHSGKKKLCRGEKLRRSQWLLHHW
jgi:hypothetical protein